MSKTSKHRSIEEIIVLASSIIASLSITPFAIYRFMQGQHYIAIVELISITIMACIGLYVWKTGRAKFMSLVISVFMLSGLVGLNYMIGSSILFWVYPIIMTVYFLNSLPISIMLVNPAILALVPLLISEKTPVEVISIVITLFICQLFGHILSFKIKKQQEYMEALINQDGLTGALNRRALDERLEFLYSYSLRHKVKNANHVSIIMFDIDNFKSINDEYGHLEGDQILINISNMVKSRIRKTDQLYRYGGEEFIIIANGSDVLSATELAEKIRMQLESAILSEKTAVTASFGVAELQKLENPKCLIDRADKSLYRAKRAGKNRVFIASKAENMSVVNRSRSRLQSA